MKLKAFVNRYESKKSYEAARELISAFLAGLSDETLQHVTKALI